MSKFWERFFYAFTWLTQGSSYLSPKAYATLHRMHHAYSDTEKDPHSPHFSSNAFTMMWKTKKIYSGFLKKDSVVEDRFGRDIPQWDFMEHLGDNWISRLAWGTGYAIFYIIFAEYWWLYFLLPIHFLMGPVHGAIVNWFGHKAGYSNFDNNDKSKNTLVMDVVMGGELFQNNHHKFADSPNFAKKWYELDPTYPVIRVLDFLRIIRLNPVKAAAINGDLQTAKR